MMHSVRTGIARILFVKHECTIEEIGWTLFEKGGNKGGEIDAAVYYLYTKQYKSVVSDEIGISNRLVKTVKTQKTQKDEIDWYTPLYEEN